MKGQEIVKLITTTQMEVSIAAHFGIREHIIVPNIHWGMDMHECDLFILRESGYAIEVEIKRSKQDLINEGWKLHAHKDRLHRIKELYFAVPIALWEKNIEHLIPERAGILVVHRNARGTMWVKKIKKAKPDPIARKLTMEEKFQVARLGCMRIWALKRKIIELK